MATTREQAYAALFALVTSVTGAVTTDRRLKHWDDVMPEKQPALFQVEHGENWRQKRGLPAIVGLRAELFLYCNRGMDDTIVPSTQINAMVEAVAAALAPDPVTGVNTLGGLVHHCWITGQPAFAEGTMGPQSVVVIPVDILLTN